jgi:hypothetical protein
MRTITSRAASVKLALLALLAGAVCVYEPVAAVLAAPPPASASPSASVAAPARPHLALSAYAWPAELSAEPKEEDWASATDLEPFRRNTDAIDAEGLRSAGWCNPRVVGSWLRLTCTAGIHFGIVWGLAGDLAKVKGTIPLVSEVERPTKPTADWAETATRNMGVSATVTFPVAPGSALVLEIDQIDIDNGYEGSVVFTHPWALVDVSWAVGEKAPTVLVR